MSAGGCRLDLVQHVTLDREPYRSVREPAGVRVAGLSWPNTLTAIEARQLSAALQGAAEVLEAAAS
jgi:hypothetical protein